MPRDIARDIARHQIIENIRDLGRFEAWLFRGDDRSLVLSNPAAPAVIKG